MIIYPCVWKYHTYAAPLDLGKEPSYTNQTKFISYGATAQEEPFL